MRTSKSPHLHVTKLMFTLLAFAVCKFNSWSTASICKYTRANRPDNSPDTFDSAKRVQFFRDASLRAAQINPAFDKLPLFTLRDRRPERAATLVVLHLILFCSWKKTTRSCLSRGDVIWTSECLILDREGKERTKSNGWVQSSRQITVFND